MKKIPLLLFLFPLCLYSQVSEGPVVIENVNVCEGEKFRIFENMYLPVRTREIIDEQCNYTRSIRPNYEEFIIDDENTSSRSIREESIADGTIAIAEYLEYVAKESKTITIKVTRHTEREYAKSTCCPFHHNYPDYCNLTRHTDTYVFIVNVYPVGHPTLTSNKAIVSNTSSSVTLKVSGCASSLTTIYFYRTGCDGQLLPAGSVNSPNNIITTGAGGNSTYQAMCMNMLLGCTSELSNKVRIANAPTIPNPPNGPNLTEIDNIQNTGSADYHHYSVETEICDKSSGNPNCTREAVFNLLKSSKTNQGITVGDFQDVPLVPNLYGHLGASNLIFHSDDSPIQNYEIVNLPGIVSVDLGIAALGIEKIGEVLPDGTYQYINMPISHILKRLGNTKGVANPIMMTIDPVNYSVTNYTLLGHILHPGKVVRTVVEECNKIKIVTVGYGGNWVGQLPNPFPADKLNYAIFERVKAEAEAFMSDRNNKDGMNLFQSVDSRLKQRFNDLSK